MFAESKNQQARDQGERESQKRSQAKPSKEVR